VLQFARGGVVTGASGRNWADYGDAVELGAGIDDAERALLTDPQTSGGLLVACSPDAVSDVLEVFAHEGFAAATVIGEVHAGAPRVTVRRA
jgi:selenide, water dikinase